MITVLPEQTVFESPANTIVNPVNCVGVMGKGLALAVKTLYPEVFDKYLAACETGRMEVGKLQLVRTPNRWVLNFPTKKHWRGASKVEFIEAGLKKFAKTYRRQRIVSIAFPPLGCGHGGLKWHHVEPLMRRYLEPLENIEIFFCLGTSKAPQSPARSRRRSQANEMAAGTKAGQRGLWADEP